MLYGLRTLYFAFCMLCLYGLRTESDTSLLYSALVPSSKGCFHLFELIFCQVAVFEILD